jgi:hypothetical protein
MSVENYKEFQFRFCWDVDYPNAIRIYVEKRPQKTKQMNPEEIFLNPAQGGAPEYIRFPNDRRISLFMEAQAIAHEWANRVLMLADGKPALDTERNVCGKNISNERISHERSRK